MIGPLVNQFVLRLRCAERVEKQFVIVNRRTQFLIRFVVTAVEETAAIFFPRRARELDPVEDILSIFARLDVAYFPLLPIGPGGGESVSEKFRIVGHIQSAQRDRAVLGQCVWIEKLPGLLRQVR